MILREVKQSETIIELRVSEETSFIIFTEKRALRLRFTCVWLNGGALGSVPTRETWQPDQGYDAFSVSGIRLCMTVGTAARQAPLSKGLSQSLHELCSGDRPGELSAVTRRQGARPLCPSLTSLGCELP